MSELKPIREVYPDCGEEPFYGPCSYQPLLESLGHEILVQVDDDDYQGDSRLLVRASDGRIGYLQFGWGSCSGCDALQGASSYHELDELRSSIAGGVRWFETAALAGEWFASHDWAGDYCWHDNEQKQFVEKAKAWLAEAVSKA